MATKTKLDESIQYDYAKMAITAIKQKFPWFSEGTKEKKPLYQIDWNDINVLFYVRRWHLIQAWIDLTAGEIIFVDLQTFNLLWTVPLESIADDIDMILQDLENKYIK